VCKKVKSLQHIQFSKTLISEKEKLNKHICGFNVISELCYSIQYTHTQDPQKKNQTLVNYLWLMYQGAPLDT